MKNKNLIWLGLGAVALYLYFRNKPKASASTPIVAPPPSVLTTTKIPPPISPRPIPKSINDLIAPIYDSGLNLSFNPKMNCAELKALQENEKKIRYIRAEQLSEKTPQELANFKAKQEAYRKCGLI